MHFWTCSLLSAAQRIARRVVKFTVRIGFWRCTMWRWHLLLLRLGCIEPLYSTSHTVTDIHDMMMTQDCGRNRVYCMYTSHRGVARGRRLYLVSLSEDGTEYFKRRNRALEKIKEVRAASRPFISAAASVSDATCFRPG